MVKGVHQPVIEKEDLKNLTEGEIKDLVQLGLLAMHRIVGKYLLSLPGAGTFIASQEMGRKALLRIIRSTKFNEILEVEISKRKMPIDSRFDVKYFLLDLTGSEDLICINSPTGRLYRCP